MKRVASQQAQSYARSFKSSRNVFKNVGRELEIEIQSRLDDMLHDLGESIDTAMDYFVQEVGRRYHSRQVPQVDPFTGRQFPRTTFKSRSGRLRSVSIPHQVQKTALQSANSKKSLRGRAVILLPRVAGGPPRPEPSNDYTVPDLPIDPEEHIDEKKGWSDYFSAIEYGSPYMRGAEQSYTDFEGFQHFGIRGFFEVDRIVKDEFLLLSEIVDSELDLQLEYHF